MKQLLLCAAILSGSYAALAQTNDADVRQPFIEAKIELENMLDGKTPLSYERAVVITENAYWQGSMNKNAFHGVISKYVAYIQKLAAEQPPISFGEPTNVLEVAQLSETEREENYRCAVINHAIFRFIADTSMVVDQGDILYHFPYAYSTSDPLGSNDWANTQVSQVLDNKKGNCFALASLYKILSERLHSNAWLCTAPGHIYIRHNDKKGVRFNVELSNGGSFPGTGTIQTLTYTTADAVRNNIALRDLDLRQSVVLCLACIIHKPALPEREAAAAGGGIARFGCVFGVDFASWA